MSDPAQRYQMLGRLIEEMPDIPNAGPISADVAQWLGRVGAIIETTDVADSIAWSGAVSQLTMGGGLQMSASQRIPVLVYAALGKAELAAPPAARGTFIPVGGQFDAFAGLSKIAMTAKLEVMIVDPYLDGSALTDFGTIVPEKILLRLLADKRSYGSSLIPAGQRWKAQYGTLRPIEVRWAPDRSLHDRALFVDRKQAWVLTQSLKDFAKRAPGEIINTHDSAGLKIAAYEAIWAQSEAAV